MNVITRITAPATLDRLGDLMSAVLSAARETGLGAASLGHLEIAAEEAIVNVCNYAYPAGDGDIEIVCMQDNDRFSVDIINSGVPFDVTAVADPDTTSDLLDRQVGGLGIFFMKKLMDDVQYRRDSGTNILTLVINRLRPESAG